jgi:pimeloyl-[acyl-carrier protein] synthase
MAERRPVNTADLISPRFIADPYSAYAALRTKLPVCWDEKQQFWVISRYEDIHPLLRDKRWSSDQLDDLMRRLPGPEQTDAAALREILTGRLVLCDSPAHHRIRGLMQLAFTPRRVESMRSAIAAIADELIDDMLERGRADLISDYADPLPARVIAAMLGLPADDRHQFKSWTDDIYGFIGFSAEPVGVRALRGTASARQLRGYLASLFAAIRANPRDDLLSAMISAEEQGDRLSQAELFSNVVGLINASHETTTNLIGNTVLALLRHSEQWQRVLAEPALAAGAVEEGLRYDSPVQMLLRRAVEDVRVGDVMIPRGDRALLLLGSANRDPVVYDNPDRFDLTRDGVKHVAFGGGPHYCLGAALGRLEGQMALAAICRRLPSLRLASSRAEWRPLPVFRGLRALPVEF